MIDTSQMPELASKLRMLLHEAQDSFKKAISYAGPDPRLGFIMMKWPDVFDSVINLLENRTFDNYNKVVKDLEPLVCEPLFVVVEVLAVGRGMENKVKNLRQTMASYKSPELIKPQLVALIEEMIK